MDYINHYNLLINKAKIKNTLPDVYYEVHHIIPTCIGGKNTIINKVSLTPEEHFVAHQLLVKIYPSSLNLIKACQMMTNGNSRVKRNNKLYGWIRRRLSEKSSKRITVDGVIYKSIKHCAIIFGISSDVVRHRCKSIKFLLWNFTDCPAEKKIGYRTINKIICEGTLFPSAVQAAVYFNISKSVVGHRCKSDKWPTWAIIGKENNKIHKRNKSQPKQRVTCDNILYENIYDAANFFKISTATIMHRIESVNYPSWNFIENPIIKTKGRIKIVICDGIEYESLKIASKLLNMSVQAISYRFKSKNFESWYQK